MLVTDAVIVGILMIALIAALLEIGLRALEKKFVDGPRLPIAKLSINSGCHEGNRIMGIVLTRLTPAIGAIVEARICPPRSMPKSVRCSKLRWWSIRCCSFADRISRPSSIKPLRLASAICTSIRFIRKLTMPPRSWCWIPNGTICRTMQSGIRMLRSSRLPRWGRLAARKLPPTGGDTLWASAAAAYEGLSPPFQKLLDGLTATYEFIKSFPLERFGNGPEALDKWEKARRESNPPIIHPVIRTHPVSGRKALFVNDGFTTRINELEPKESAAVLAFLFEHLAKPEYVVRWRWQEGDVAFLG